MSEYKSAARDCQLSLARDRTAMALERTFAAWIRTGLAALAFGIALNKLRIGDMPWLSRVAESGLILFAVLCFIIALRRVSKVAGMEAPDPSVAFRLLPTISLDLLGASIAALVDVWV